MRYYTVPSSNIGDVCYDPETKVLDVIFAKTKKHYRYRGVPARTVTRLMWADSPGALFHQLIRSSYSAEEVESQTATVAAQLKQVKGNSIEARGRTVTVKRRKAKA